MIGKPSVTFGPPEGEELHRDQPLIVVARDHGVELASHRTSEHRVARIRPVDPCATLLRRLDRRSQNLAFLMTKETILAGVGFSPATARRGCAIPNRGSSRAARSMIPSITSRVSVFVTDASGM